MSELFASETDKMSYAMGMNLGEYLKSNPVELNFAAAVEGLRDLLFHQPKLSQEEYEESMQNLQKRMQEAEREQAASANVLAEKKFMAENARRPGVVVTPSGLQYEVLTPGSGARPGGSSVVRVHYTGTLLDGTKFDSSVDRGEPAEFGVDQVISGWSEALQLMPVGGRYKLYIPAALAYGEEGADTLIPPNAALIFEVELLGIVG